MLLFKCGPNFLLRSMKQTRYTMQIWSPHHEKHTKLEKIVTIEKMIPQGGTLGPSKVEKNFCRNFANKLYIRSSYGVLITKKHKIRKNLNDRKIDTPRGPLGVRRSKKFFVEILRTNYIFGVHMGSSSQKTQN